MAEGRVDLNYAIVKYLKDYQKTAEQSDDVGESLEGRVLAVTITWDKPQLMIITSDNVLDNLVLPQHRRSFSTPLSLLLVTSSPKRGTSLIYAKCKC